MITYNSGSIFDSLAQTLVNPVNTVGVMGRGLAATFKRLYPEMYRQYRYLCLQGKLNIGDLYIYSCPFGTSDDIIVNFPTKRHWRDPSQVEYLDAGLRKFVRQYALYGISSVSFPMLGCGCGGLDWEIQVQPVMEHYLQNLPIPVYIHVFSGGN